ncbi:MAG: hypothetical protein A3J39_08480 [Sulfuricurvum sp. RIFCSPHIGHO2_12_FULL_44_8]|nr:MAG: hypothetical protein A3J39_08480 [Sulfuricurvum sp. RIFCSPHIGHO2_12_FULL_44_8]
MFYETSLPITEATESPHSHREWWGGMNKQTIIQGDCLEVMKTFADKSFDLVLTDPPYGLEKFGSWDTFDQGFHEEWLSECNRLLKDNGQMYVFWGHFYLEAFLCMCWHDAIIYWMKPKPIINPKSRRWVASVEHILWWHKGKEYTWNFPAHPTELCNVFKDSLAKQKEGKSYHRNQKPLSVINKLIERSTNEGDTILDPFLGSGTTLVAAKQLNRNAVGIEISPEYCEIARKRLEQQTLL